MSSFRHLTEEIWLVSVVVLGAMIFGATVGMVGESLFIVALAYLAWHLRQIARLKEWLTSSHNFHPPESIGIWSDIFNSIYLLRKRNRKSKKRLAKIIKEFRSSTAAIPDGAVVLGETGEIIWFNKSAGILLGLNNKLDIGQRVTNLIRHPLFVSYVAQRDYQLPVELNSPVDESIRLSMRITPYNRNQRLLVARNISRLHQLEKVRQDFVANVSHELRTPLTVVTGYLEIMNDAKESLPELFERPISQMEHQVNRMRSLVDDLLTLSKLESGADQVDKVTLRPARILQSIADEAKNLSAGNHLFSLSLDSEIKIRGNEKELHSAFSNLIFNAVRYTPKGGRITLSVKQVDDLVEVSVADSGDGIAAHHLPRLTERFYRVDPGRDRSMGGTGLGLAIVKHVLERHGSKLEIFSELGTGSCFSCQFNIEK